MFVKVYWNICNKMKIFLLVLALFLLFSTPSYGYELKGKASYYSRAGCLGCSSNFTMANGDTLNDSKLTIALTPGIVREHKLLNDYVGVINTSNNKWTLAKVTDTGGFAKYNRVADLGLAVKNKIECKSICDVIIVF